LVISRLALLVVRNHAVTGNTNQSARALFQRWAPPPRQDNYRRVTPVLHFILYINVDK